MPADLLALSRRLHAALDALGIDPWRAGVRPVYRGDESKAHRLTYVTVERDGECEDVPVMEPGGPENFPAWGWPEKGSGWLLDLSDLLTRHAVLAFAREAWDDETLYAVPFSRGGWVACSPVGSQRPLRTGPARTWRAPTELEVFIAAIEARAQEASDGRE